MANRQCCNFTNEKNQTLCRGFNTLGPFHLELAHARDYWADEIDIKYREDVDQMKRECNGQKAKTIDSRHGKGDILMFPSEMSTASSSGND